MGLNGGGKHIQALHGVVIAVKVVLYHLHRLKALKAGFLGYLVLSVIGVMFEVAYIGDIAHVSHLIAEMAEITEYYIEGDGRPGVAEVSVAIYRRAAHIHPYASFMDRSKRFFLARERVIDGQVVLFHRCSM